MTIFIDTNILLDVFTQRQPHFASAARLWAEVEGGSVEGIVSAISFNNVYYVIRKAGGAAKAREAVRILNTLFAVASLDTVIIQQAIGSDISDFEDAIQYLSALRAGVAHFVTRDANDFPGQPLNVVSAEEMMVVLASSGGEKPS